MSTFLRSLCNENYWNRFIFDRVITRIKRGTFLGHSVDVESHCVRWPTQAFGGRKPWCVGRISAVVLYSCCHFMFCRWCLWLLYYCTVLSICKSSVLSLVTYTASLQAQNLPFQQILPTIDFFYLLDCLTITGPDWTYYAHHFIFSFTF